MATVAAATAFVMLLLPAGSMALSDIRISQNRPYDGGLPSLIKFVDSKIAEKSRDESFSLNFSRNYINLLQVGKRAIINVTISSLDNRTGSYALRTSTSDNRVLNVVINSERSWSVAGDRNRTVVFPVELEGLFLGYSFVRFSILRNEDHPGQVERREENDILVSVIRPLGVINLVSDVFIYIILISSQLAMGSQMDLPAIKDLIKKPKPLLVGLGCQFTIMPLVSYGILTLMSWTGGAALGFFALGCAPGGGLSNLYTALLDGEVSLSVVMTILSSLFALGFIPMWMFTLGATIEAEDGSGSVRIPFENMATSLAIIIGPLLVGILAQYKLPRLSALIGKFMRPVFLLFVIVAYVLVMFSNSYVFDRFEAGMVLSASALPAGGFLLAMFVAYALKLKWSIIKTVAIETGVQNAVIATIIVNWSLKKPDADLALIPVMAAMLVGPSPLVLVCIVYNIYKKCSERLAKQREEENHVASSLAFDLPTLGKHAEPVKSECENVQ